MTREEAVKMLQVTRLMLMDGANQPISDLYYALDMAIEALEQTDPSDSEKPNNCDTCIHNKLEWYSEVCDGCSKAHSNYEPKLQGKHADMVIIDEPQTEYKRWEVPPKVEPQTEITTCVSVLACLLEIEDEPQTDLLVKTPRKSRESHEIADAPLTDAEITELAKEIVHKMIDNSVIAEDAYPDLRQRMHEAVERLDEYYPSEDERSE